MYDSDERHDPAEDLGRRVLEQHGRFQLVLLDGTRWSCRLLDWGQNQLLVQTEDGQRLVWQHAVAYALLEEAPPAVVREATAVVVASDQEVMAGDTVQTSTVFTSTEEQPDPPVP